VQHPEVPNFKPITDLTPYAFLIAQKGYESGPVIWLDPNVNIPNVVKVLRLFADQIELTAREDPDVPASDWEKSDRYNPHPP
jgi:hypothetical protein